MGLGAGIAATEVTIVVRIAGGGAIPVRDQVELITKAGFVDLEHVGMTGFTTSRRTVAALFRARKP